MHEKQSGRLARGHIHRFLQVKGDVQEGEGGMFGTPNRYPVDQPVINSNRKWGIRDNFLDKWFHRHPTVENARGEEN